MMHEDLLSKASLLVLANKQDLPNAVPCNEVAEKLGLRDLGARQWCGQFA